MTIDYHVAEAERLTQENGGKLPNVKWLRNNGYTNIGVCMRKNPDRFAHLEQKRLKVSAEEHVKVAEALAREHGGILPNPYWLEQNGFLALGVAIRNNPYLFTHIPQRRNYKSVEDHLVDAAKLMQEHGKIPDWLWLRDNGYAPLYQAIGRYPDKFKSFK